MKESGPRGAGGGEEVEDERRQKETKGKGMKRQMSEDDPRM